MSETFEVEESDLSYWIAAIANTRDCDDCNTCEPGDHSLKNIEKEMRQYIEEDD